MQASFTGQGFGITFVGNGEGGSDAVGLGCGSGLMGVMEVALFLVAMKREEGIGMEGKARQGQEGVSCSLRAFVLIC